MKMHLNFFMFKAVPGFVMLGNGAGSISTVPGYPTFLLTLSNSCGFVFIGFVGSKSYNYTIILKQYQRKHFENIFFFNFFYSFSQEKNTNRFAVPNC
jgi:hypothetical protein